MKGPKMLRIFLILLTLLLVGVAGCLPSAGPFVTDVSYDGEGNLLVTKNTIVYHVWAGTISNGENPQTVVIKSPKR